MKKTLLVILLLFCFTYLCEAQTTVQTNTEILNRYEYYCDRYIKSIWNYRHHQDIYLLYCTSKDIERKDELNKKMYEAYNYLELIRITFIGYKMKVEILESRNKFSKKELIYLNNIKKEYYPTLYALGADMLE